MMIRIFAMKVTDQDFADAKWNRYLSDDRRKEAKRRRQEQERKLYLGAEILLNRSMERVLPGVSLPVDYERTIHGKPYLLPPNEGWHVNWSHSGEYVLCAVSDTEVGVDLQESVKTPKESLVRRLLQPQENAFYESEEETRRKALFYEYWTLKESFLKALGTGFSASLADFYIEWRQGCPRIVQNRNQKAYHGRLLSFADPGYTAAVCCESDEELGPIEIEYLS